VEIISHVGVGSIQFGMTRDQIREIIGGEALSYLKAPSYSEMLTDAFEENSIQVFYKKPGICEAVEFYKPQNPTLMGQSFIGVPFSQARSWFEEHDSNLELEVSGLTSYKLGVGLYAPGYMENISEPVESLIVFEKGYYES
jgi:hypothetical protein